MNNRVIEKEGNWSPLRSHLWCQSIRFCQLFHSNDGSAVNNVCFNLVEFILTILLASTNHLTFWVAYQGSCCHTGYSLVWLSAPEPMFTGWLFRRFVSVKCLRCKRITLFSVWIMQPVIDYAVNHSSRIERRSRLLQSGIGSLYALSSHPAVSIAVPIAGL